jgi:uncharacterized protein YjdB
MNQVKKLKPYLRINNINLTSGPHPLVRSYFTASEIASIYGFPNNPLANTNKTTVVGVISFGGGLIGNVSSTGILTGGDVQAYWASLGISSENMPTVVIVLVNGARNSPNPADGATIENTIDVETIGACCPTSKLTIILYIVPNSFSSFTTVFNYALNTPVPVNGLNLKPSIISVSWGSSEDNFGPSLANSIDSVFATAVSRGINICCAAGDNGSSDGVNDGLNHCDFPSSSPNVISCGGTRLVCPNYVYDNQTVETVWNNNGFATGGGVSNIFSLPSYQSSLGRIRRSVPDIALDADPATGIVYTIGGSSMVVGGTSIVSPAIAGYLACTNINYFINTRIYSSYNTLYTSCYNDITVGNNGAFAASSGYDNCTGIGSMIGSGLTTKLVLGINNISVTGIVVNNSTISVNVSATSQILATIAPFNATNQSVTWSSSNTSVATVVNGLITGVSTGTSTVSVTTIDGSYTANVSVTVVIGVSSVSVAPTSILLHPTQTYQIVETVLPSNAPNKNVSWSTNRPTVATVTSSGLIQAIGNGTATITVRTQYGNKTATVSVTVTTLVTSVRVNVTSITLRPNITRQITATVLPSTASNKAITWSSNNTNVATVNSQGLIRGLRVGNATITVRTLDGNRTATVSVRVNASLIFNNKRILNTLINKYK